MSLKIYQPVVFHRRRHRARQEQVVFSPPPVPTFPLFFAWIANNQVLVQSSSNRLEAGSEIWSDRLQGFIRPLGTDEEKGRVLQWSSNQGQLRCAA